MLAQKANHLKKMKQLYTKIKSIWIKTLKYTKNNKIEEENLVHNKYNPGAGETQQHKNHFDNTKIKLFEWQIYLSSIIYYNIKYLHINISNTLIEYLGKNSQFRRSPEVY